MMDVYTRLSEGLFCFKKKIESDFAGFNSSNLTGGTDSSCISKFVEWTSSRSLRRATWQAGLKLEALDLRNFCRSQRDCRSTIWLALAQRTQQTRSRHMTQILFGRSALIPDQGSKLESSL